MAFVDSHMLTFDEQLAAFREVYPDEISFNVPANPIDSPVQEDLVMPWESMTNAPTDGTLIDLLFDGYVREIDCHWDGAQWTRYEWTGATASKHQIKRRFVEEPTHWMHRPKLPGS